MIYEFAPLEGITDFTFRQVHSRFFPKADRYYTPFLVPTANRVFTERQIRETCPENNPNIQLIPQLIGHNSDDFCYLAGRLAEFSYAEVNLNLGCPSGTVVAKKKGAGLLGDLPLLQSFLDGVFSDCPLAVSAKIRIGLKSPDEFPALLELLNQYPFSSLIIHPRIQTQMYKGTPELSAWEYAVRNSKAPLCYNGDIFNRECAQRFVAKYPDTGRIMIGRGLIANPALLRELDGGPALTLSELQKYHLALYDAYREKLLYVKPTLLHMKELWTYLSCSLDCEKKLLKALYKSQTFSDYEQAVSLIFRNADIRSPAGYNP